MNYLTRWYLPRSVVFVRFIFSTGMVSVGLLLPAVDVTGGLIESAGRPAAVDSGVRVPPAPAASPNIIIFLIDDLGWADLGCYGNRWIDTPNIDAMAHQGIRFTDAYACGAVCSPTRASLMTGKHPARLAITDFIPGHWRPYEQLVVPAIENQLHLAETSLAELVKPRDYRTCFLGKWHLGGREFYPDRQGFDKMLVQSGRHFGTRLIGSPDVQLEDDEYLTERLTQEAIQFVRETREEPFLLVLSHYAVHIPLQARDSRIDKYRSRFAGKEVAYHPTYAAMVEHVDDSLGALVDEVDRIGLGDNTLFLLVSDNGGLVQRFDGKGERVGTNHPLRDEKGTLYEGGVRVPMIARWTGRVPAGVVCDQPVASVDIFATVADLVGEETDETIDGMSLEPVFRGERLQRDALYWHYPHYHHMDPAGSIRVGKYKLIEHFDDGQLELYDLNADPSESTDLSQLESQTATELHRRLKDWRESIDARMPTINTEFDRQRAHLWRSRRRDR